MDVAAEVLNLSQNLANLENNFVISQEYVYLHMVYLEGIKLTANRVDELHKIAHKVVLSKGWYNPDPYPHYTVICPFKQEKIKKLLEKVK